jgi:ribosomal protein L9
MVEITPAFMSVPYSEAQSTSPSPAEGGLGGKYKSAADLYAEIHQKVSSLTPIEFRRVRIAKDSVKIFGSVTAQDVANYLKESHDIEIDMNFIIFGGDGRLKEVGSHQVSISLPEYENVPITIDVVDA